MGSPKRASPKAILEAASYELEVRFSTAAAVTVLVERSGRRDPGVPRKLIQELLQSWVKASNQESLELDE